jgi:hypothetical protein
LCGSLCPAPGAVHGLAAHQAAGTAGDSGISSRSSGSTVSRGSHSSQRGRYQFQSPSSFIAAGSSTPRISVASINTAVEEPEPEPEPESETVLYDLPPGSSPILHCAPPPIFAPATTTEPPAGPLPGPGLYVFQGEGGPLIPLVKHAAGDDVQVHILNSREAAADLLRAFGGDPRFLDTIHDADPQADTA